MEQSISAPPPLAAVYYTDPVQKKRARALADSLGIPLISDPGGHDFVLTFVNDRLTLAAPNDPSMKGQVSAEFVRGAAGYRRKQGQKELLLKAIGFRRDQPPYVLDATGGLGKDSFLMASRGCTVHILERNRIVHTLLQDGLRRASEHPETREIAGRIRLTLIDSLRYFEAKSVGKEYDVIYLDPMYPQRSKSALVKKEMQMLQKLLGHGDNGDRLVDAALAAGCGRVVVKRPGKAPCLGSRAPSHSITGTTTRYDVYLASPQI